MSADDVADARQRQLIALSARATNRSLRLWAQMDYADFDSSWNRIAPAMTSYVASMQLASARGSDQYTTKVASEFDFAPARSRVTPEAFAGVDGSGRPLESLLHGAVTTTKTAVGSGLGAVQSFEAGAAYLAAMVKTAMADIGRTADMVSSAGKGFTRYARVVEPGACSRCIVLAGATQFKPFKRHPACKCHVEPLPEEIYASDPRTSPDAVFHSMSEAEQDRAFGKAGAEAIREGADVGQVVSARRGASGVSVAAKTPSTAQWNRMTKTTIGTRPDGTAVRVYTTTEGTTARGRFGRAQADMGRARRLAGARYASTARVRLMPETIMEIAGDDQALRRAFLRDAGYLEYFPTRGYDSGNKWIAEIAEMRRQDRILVDRATKRYGNFYLG